mmetsp:Transcript_66118/g.184120  ORF Transcript_66118/g.184120 Transcript_66118/m.184120 type:complete len:206 (+) Transcript_66118:778-1395(+)
MTCGLQASKITDVRKRVAVALPVPIPLARAPAPAFALAGTLLAFPLLAFLPLALVLAPTFTLVSPAFAPRLARPLPSAFKSMLLPQELLQQTDSPLALIWQSAKLLALFLRSGLPLHVAPTWEVAPARGHPCAVFLFGVRRNRTVGGLRVGEPMRRHCELGAGERAAWLGAPYVHLFAMPLVLILPLQVLVANVAEPFTDGEVTF